MRAKVLFSLIGAVIVSIALASASGAATVETQKVTRIDVSTRAAVIHYLHSIHVNAKGAVIQRGGLNYAGAHCPAKGWTCASTQHTVVQIATRGGQNRFLCRSSSCSVVQFSGVSRGVYIRGRSLASTAMPPKPNKAACIKTTGLTQSCSITQSSPAGNTAMVWEDAGKQRGLTQTALYSVSISQQANGSGTGPNLACVHQSVFIDGSTTNTSSKGATATLEAHQSIGIAQASTSGTNTLEDASLVNGVAGCLTLPASCPSDLSQACGLSQTQILNSLAVSKGLVVQNENKTNNGANLTLDIKQNCPTVDANNVCTGGTYSGTNSAVFTQSNNLTAVANTPAGATQWQSSQDGGILAAVHQYSGDVSTAIARQYETQCEDAQPSGLTSCDNSGDQDQPTGYPLTQTQFGPVKKAPGDSSQTGNGGDSFAVSQKSQQDNDTASGQTNFVSGGFHTDGTGSVSQTTTVDGQTSTDNQAGTGDVSGTTNCTGFACTSTPPPAPIVDSNPSNPSNSPEAKFTFHDTDGSATFLCKLDLDSYAACTSGQTYTGLADSSHTFSVEAKNPTTGAISAPTSYTWTVAAFTISGAQLTATNVDVAEFGYGGMRVNTSTNGTAGDGTGTINVSGFSGKMLKALLYWNGPTSVADPNSNANVSFADTPIAGANIGTASSNCWNTPGDGVAYTNSQSYVANVTNLVSGNGSYDLSNFFKTDGNGNDSDINGVALVLFYDDGNTSNDRNVVLWAGNDSSVTDGTDPDGWNETLTGVPGSSSDGSLDLIVSDGQSFNDAAVVINGSTTIAPTGGIFQGASTPAGPGNFQGDLWDVKSFTLPASLLGGSSNTLNLTAGEDADCLSLVVAVANVPVTSGPILVAPRFQSNSLSTTTGASATPGRRPPAGTPGSSR